MIDRLFNLFGWVAVLGTIQAWGCAGDLASQKSDRIIPSRSNSVKRVVEVLWRVALVEPDYTSQERHHYGKPVVSEDGRRVFAGDQAGGFHCLDTSDGTVLWRKITSGPIGSQPTSSGDMVYVGNADGTLFAYRFSDGETLWTYQATASIEGRPVVVNDKLLVMTAANTLLCLDAQTGKWLWSYKRNIPVGKFQVKGVANPLVSDNRVFVGFSDGFLTVLSLKDGSVLSAKKLSPLSERFTDLDTDPLRVGDNLVVGVFSAGIIALDFKTLKEKWTSPAIGPSQMVFDNGDLYLSTAKAEVLSLDAKTGRRKWMFSSKKGVLSEPALARGHVLVSSSEHSLIVLNRRNGKMIQVFNPGKGSHAAPVIYGNRVYWVSNGETLYAMSLVQ